jgi:hypothetical protein
MVTANSVTRDMVKWTLAVIACVGSVAGYIEFRSTENANVVKHDIESEIEWLRTEFSSDLKTKYDLQSGIKLEQVLENQKELLRLALENQKDIQQTTKEVLKLTQKLESDINIIKATKQ